MIVLFHVSISLLPENSFAEQIFGSNLEILGSFGNSAFFLIAGYFIGNGTTKLPRLKKILIPTSFYGLISFLICVIYFRSIPQWEPIRYIFVFITANLGFVEGYAAVQLVSKLMIKKYLRFRLRFQIIIIISSVSTTLVNVILNSFFHYMDIVGQFIPNGILAYGLNYFWVFLVGATLKNVKFHFSNFALFVAGTIMLLINANFSLDKLLGITYQGIGFYLTGPTITICFFLVFVNINLPYNRKINDFAKLTFGIYIVHQSFGSPIAYFISANSPITQYVLNHQIPVLPWLFFMTISVILISALIEYIRQKIFARLPFQKLLN
jgi:hypothetical protein